MNAVTSIESRVVLHLGSPGRAALEGPKFVGNMHSKPEASFEDHVPRSMNSISSMWSRWDGQSRSTL
jgi:hypothetical protein